MDGDSPLLMGLLFVAANLLIISMATIILHKFIALKMRPGPRAAWTIGIAYLLATAIWVFGGPPEAIAYAPLAAVPGALLAYWYWQGEFRRAWVEDPNQLPEGVNLANDDWRIGLFAVVAAVIIAVLKWYLLSV